MSWLSAADDRDNFLIIDPPAYVIDASTVPAGHGMHTMLRTAGFLTTQTSD
jgi:hypothetical protein